MVDVSVPSKTDASAKAKTHATTITTTKQEEGPEFRFVLSQSPASSTMLLDSRYDSCQIVDRVEVCPEGAKYARQLAQRLQTDQGCGLYIDYGIDGIPSDSLRVCVLPCIMMHVCKLNDYKKNPKNRRLKTTSL